MARRTVRRLSAIERDTRYFITLTGHDGRTAGGPAVPALHEASRIARAYVGSGEWAKASVSDGFMNGMHIHTYGAR